MLEHIKSTFQILKKNENYGGNKKLRCLKWRDKSGKIFIYRNKIAHISPNVPIGSFRTNCDRVKSKAHALLARENPFLITFGPQIRMACV